MTISTTGWSGPVAPPSVERLGPELSAARRLLRRLVQVMAAPVSAQERSRGSALQAAARSVSAFLIRCASSSTTSPQRITAMTPAPGGGPRSSSACGSASATASVGGLAAAAASFPSSSSLMAASR